MSSFRELEPIPNSAHSIVDEQDDREQSPPSPSVTDMEQPPDQEPLNIMVLTKEFDPDLEELGKDFTSEEVLQIQNPAQNPDLDFVQQLADGTVRLSFNRSRLSTPLDYEYRQPLDASQFIYNRSL